MLLSVRVFEGMVGKREGRRTGEKEEATVGERKGWRETRREGEGEREEGGRK